MRTYPPEQMRGAMLNLLEGFYGPARSSTNTSAPVPEEDALLTRTPVQNQYGGNDFEPSTYGPSDTSMIPPYAAYGQPPYSSHPFDDHNASDTTYYGSHAVYDQNVSNTAYYGSYPVYGHNASDKPYYGNSNNIQSLPQFSASHYSAVATDGSASSTSSSRSSVPIFQCPPLNKIRMSAPQGTGIVAQPVILDGNTSETKIASTGALKQSSFSITNGTGGLNILPAKQIPDQPKEAIKTIAPAVKSILTSPPFEYRLLPELDSRFQHPATGTPEIHLVNTPSLMEKFMELFEDLQPDRLCLMIDLEGFNHGRHGTLSTIQVTFVRQPYVTYVIDLLILRHQAFDISSPNGLSLKIILENPKVCKVIFDTRQDNAALYGECKIVLDGAIDLQLMDIACRPSQREYLKGLQTCIKKFVHLSSEELAAFSAAKSVGTKYYSTNPSIWLVRPTAQDLLQYAANDTIYMAALFEVFRKRLVTEPYWQNAVWVESNLRLKDSRSPDFVSTKGR